MKFVSTKAAGQTPASSNPTAWSVRRWPSSTHLTGTVSCWSFKTEMAFFVTGELGLAQAEVVVALNFLTDRRYRDSHWESAQRLCKAAEFTGIAATTWDGELVSISCTYRGS